MEEVELDQAATASGMPIAILMCFFVSIWRSMLCESCEQRIRADEVTESNRITHLTVALRCDQSWLIVQRVRGARLISEHSSIEILNDVACALKYPAQCSALTTTYRFEREWLSGDSMTDDEPAWRVKQQTPRRPTVRR